MMGVSNAIDELLLNAVALEFVITLDELIFEALAPDHAKRAVERTRGFTLPKTRYKGMDWGAILSFTLVAVQLTWAYSTYLSPQLDILEGIKDAVCAGDRDFVFAIDGMGTVTWGYPPTVTNLGDLSASPGFVPWPNKAGEVFANHNEVIIDSIIIGTGRQDCPLDQCYGTVYPGTPPVPLHPSRRSECCVTQQTKAPLHRVRLVQRANESDPRYAGDHGHVRCVPSRSAAPLCSPDLPELASVCASLTIHSHPSL